ncbi:MAG: hypothetical protein Q8Q17_02540 [bacterium]|nr:hypothetical protein [bacterium]
MSKLMQSIFALLLLVGVLVGCSEKPNTYEGKSAKEWADVAKQPQAVAPQMPVQPSPEERLKAQQEAAEQAKREEAERVRLDKVYNDEYLAKVRERANEIQSSKDGKVLFGAARYMLESAGMYEGPAGVVLGGMWQYHDAFKRGLLQMGIASETGQTTSAETDYSAQTQIRAVVIGWFVSDQMRLDTLWSTVRPLLRLKYGLLMTLRQHEQLFKTSYAAKTFQPLHECLLWHEEFTFLQRVGEKTNAPHPEKNSCSGIFKKFGVKAEFGETGNTQQELAARNALWIVRFLARRSADGQDRFAQNFQRLALDYIKQ